jgi:hypothetical protein
MEKDIDIIDPDGFTFDEQPTPIAFHPLPVPARCCGTILQASYAAHYGFCCPQCGAPVCYTCGCVEHEACSVTVTSLDGRQSAEYTCAWAEPGVCSFCFSRAAYEFYQEVTGRPKDDAYYMSLGHSVRAVKGLDWRIGHQ